MDGDKGGRKCCGENLKKVGKSGRRRKGGKHITAYSGNQS